MTNIKDIIDEAQLELKVMHADDVITELMTVALLNDPDEVTKIIDTLISRYMTASEGPCGHSHRSEMIALAAMLRDYLPRIRNICTGFTACLEKAKAKERAKVAKHAN